MSLRAIRSGPAPLADLADHTAALEGAAATCPRSALPELLGWAARFRGILELRLGEPSRELAQLLEAREERDAVLSLQDAARYMGEPPETFRRRLEYRKALESRPGERRLRYSRAELDRIKGLRLAANAVH